MARGKQIIAQETDINKNSQNHEISVQPGQVFMYKHMRFVILESTDMGIVAISAQTIDTKIKFAENTDKGSNNWKTSYLRKYLNTTILDQFNTDDLIHITTDLTADTGETDYGECSDLISIPTDYILRKFHTLIPNYKSWIWSATPWAINYSTMSTVSVRTAAKTIYSELPNKELGVAILCLFNKNCINNNTIKFKNE